MRDPACPVCTLFTKKGWAEGAAQEPAQPVQAPGKATETPRKPCGGCGGKYKGPLPVPRTAASVAHPPREAKGPLRVRR